MSTSVNNVEMPDCIFRSSGFPLQFSGARFGLNREFGRSGSFFTMIAPLTHPDSFYLNAALGWLELGNHVEANEELDRIKPALCAHPSVLAVRYQVYQKCENWAMCHDIAQTLTEYSPEECAPWVLLSIAKFRMGNAVEAYAILEPRVRKHPTDWRGLYNLACFATQLGKLREAESLLHRAIELGDGANVRELILNDPDLDRLRREFKL